MNETYHIPVLLKEAVSSLQVTKGKKYIDATLGGGGHTEEILKQGGCVLAFDVDQDAIDNARKRLAVYLSIACQACPATFSSHERGPAPHRLVGGPSLSASPQNKLTQLTLANSNFSKIEQTASSNNFMEVDGILFDLGVSTHQLENKARGFSFNSDAVLDMRMDQNLPVKALDLVNGLNEGELYELFTKLGEEHHSRSIARAIMVARKIKPIETCDDLAKIAIHVRPKRGEYDRTHPATRIFQALRIAVNDELNSLRDALPQALKILKPGGRTVVITFHSLEDRIVKNFIKENTELGRVKMITKHPLTPTEEEVKVNPRSRSAKLRVFEKI